MKKLERRGKRTLACSVLTISPFGVWLLVGRTEYYLDHKRFPWFRKARVIDILNVKLLTAEHLYWPDLDVDLHLESIKAPEHYPLMARDTAAGRKPAKAA